MPFGICALFEFNLNSSAENEVNFLPSLRKCKGHEKRDRLLVSKVEFSFQISQWNINLTYLSNFLKMS